MTEKSAESCVSSKGNDKAISILQNVIKVMMVLKNRNVAKFDVSFLKKIIFRKVFYIHKTILLVK